MLPHLAIVALNEQSTSVILLFFLTRAMTVLCDAACGGIIRSTGIFLMATDTPCGLLVLYNLVFDDTFNFGIAVFVIVERPLAATELGRLAGGATRLFADIFRRE
jgi:hypothetical protein